MRCSVVSTIARTVAMLCVLAAVAGCASFGAGQTKVILLPDEDGHVGAVSVSSAAGSRLLSLAFAEVTVASPSAEPGSVHALGEKRVDADYADLLKAQPLRPRTFILNFLLDSTTLTDESRALLPMVLKAARERHPTEIAVFGHADASGGERHNARLSADRARQVAALLRQADPSLKEIDVQWFGDRMPIVRSESREPRNRRVEIQIL